MTTATDPVTAAVRFLAEDGRAERFLAAHHDRHGLCAACTHTRVVPWPCPMGRLALEALTTRQETR